MTVPVPKGAKVVERGEFFDAIVQKRRLIRKHLDKTHNALSGYGGLFKRGFSASDIDFGLDNFIEPTNTELDNDMTGIIKKICPQCNIKPSFNPMAFSHNIIHSEFSDIEKHADDIDEYLNAFDDTVELYRRVSKRMKFSREIEDDITIIVDDVVDECSRCPDMDDALECAREQLHLRRNDVSLKVKDIMYDAAGREQRIRIHPDF